MSNGMAPAFHGILQQQHFVCHARGELGGVSHCIAALRVGIRARCLQPKNRAPALSLGCPQSSRRNRTDHYTLDTHSRQTGRILAGSIDVYSRKCAFPLGKEVAMSSKSMHACTVLRIALGTASGCLAACGGGPDLGSGPPPPGYAYITSASQGATQPGAVYQYAVGSDGSFTPLSTASVGAGATPTSIVADPTGRYVYVVNQGDATISQYVVGSGGGLVSLSPAIVNVGAPSPDIGSYVATIDPSGRFLYVVAVPLPLNPPVPSASIAQYSIGSGGTLTPLTPAYVSVPASAIGALAIEPSGHYAYLAGVTSAPAGQVSQFSIGNDGTLAPLTPLGVAATRTPDAVAIAPSGQTAYVLSSCIDSACEGQVAQYTIAANGTLTATGSTTLTGGHVIPISMVIDTSGSNAYLLTNLMGVDTNMGAVYGYAIDTAGGLVPDMPASVGVASGAVAEATYGPNLYAVSANALGSASNPQPGGHVDHYAIGPGGRLSPTGTTTLAEGFPMGIALVTAH